MHRPIVLIPGLGADERLFHRQREAFGDRLIVAELPRSQRGDDLKRYADRVAEAIAARLPGDPADADARPLLGGLSFGGQIAIEASRRIPAHGIAVISGCRWPTSMPMRFRFARVAGAPVPGAVAGWMLRRLVGVFAAREGLGADDRAVLRGMAGDIDPNELRRQGAVCADWRDPFDPPIPVHVLHGRRDWVIPMDRAARPDVIDDGRHLINLTHAAVVNRWLAECAGDGATVDGGVAGA